MPAGGWGDRAWSTEPRRIWCATPTIRARAPRRSSTRTWSFCAGACSETAGAFSSALLAEPPVEKTDRLAVHVVPAVHLHDHQSPAVALGGADERLAGEVGVARLAAQGAGIAL